MQSSNETRNRKRKALMILPLLVIPFVALVFWGIGGGKAEKQNARTLSNGLNAHLPGAKLDDQPMDKLSMYQQATKDSIARQEAERFDPFERWMNNNIPQDAQQSDHPPRYPAEESPFSPGADETNVPFATGKNKTNQDPNEAKVRARLTELEKLLAAHPSDSVTPSQKRVLPSENNDSEMEGLNSLMQTVNASSGQQDTDLTQMNQMLSKILDIQHPSLVRERLKVASEKEKGRVFPVRAESKQAIVDDLLSPASVVEPDTLIQRNGDSLVTQSVGTLSNNRFYEWGDSESETSINNAIAAVVHETQTLVTGSILELRLNQDIYVQGQLVPAGTSVFGETSLSGERLQCTISQIHYKDALFPVSLTVYDAKDGLPGIHVPGAISRDVAKQGTDQAIQSLQLATLDPSIGAQAAAAGIETAKNFLSKKTKLIKVTAKAGHPVLLLDREQQQ